MTQKAHALGMSRTTYVNASGLPDDDQITTARDQALLGRAIQDRFPRYYKYFSTASFVYHGDAIRNHNHLLGTVERRRRHQDRIYPRVRLQSGDLGASRRPLSRRRRAWRPLRPFERDAHMRELISAHIREASLQRTAPAIAEQADADASRSRAAVTKTAACACRRADPAPTATASPRVSRAVRTIRSGRCW